MRKANQQNSTKAPVTIEPDTFEKIVGFLDVNAKRRIELEEDINYRKKEILSYKREITSFSKAIQERTEGIRATQEAIAAIPPNELSIVEVKYQIDLVSKLPWVASVEVDERGKLTIVTRENVLKTVFHRRIVYKEGQRADELLPAPLTLPMPTYIICVYLQNMGNGWDRSDVLTVRLADPGSLKFMPSSNDIGMYQEAHAHWASNDSSFNIKQGGESHTGTLCLRDYRSALIESGKLGIIDLLNEVAMFLQNAGWANAYRPKMQWAATLGYQPYVVSLTRPLLNGETFQDIQNDTRNRLPKYLIDNGMSQHMYDYGAPADGEQSAINRGNMLEEMITQIRLATPDMVGIDEGGANPFAATANQLIQGIVTHDEVDDEDDNDYP